MEQNMELDIKIPSKKTRFPFKKLPKKWQIIFIIGIISFVLGIGCILFAIFKPTSETGNITFPTIPSKNSSSDIYSHLTGEPLADASLVTAPTYCIQIPNGTDGARPQAGLTQAGVIFEAIAEAGITRFAAVFQNPTSSVIGPIRSLRTYYLDFDVPFNCTIVHAGGPADAINAVRDGGYRDLTESYQYMYRSSAGNRLWNNLFTNAEKLTSFNQTNNFTSSTVKGFARMTEEEAAKARIDALSGSEFKITAPSEGSASNLSAKVSEIDLSFRSSANFNVHYTYDVDANVYRRSYASGKAHEVYRCPDDNLGDKSPENVCELTVLSPSVVIAMVVSEKKASDNYHEDVTMIGVGDAYIFQNGDVIEANWSKPARDEQIRFLDKSGNEIKLAPGQTFVSAIPNYGSVDY